MGVDPDLPSLVAWELRRPEGYVEVAHAVRSEPARLTEPYPVVVVPAGLVAA